MRRQTSLRPSEGGKLHPPVVPLVEHVTMSDAYQAFDSDPRALACIVRTEKVDWSDAVPHRGMPVGGALTFADLPIGARFNWADLESHLVRIKTGDMSLDIVDGDGDRTPGAMQWTTDPVQVLP